MLRITITSLSIRAIIISIILDFNYHYLFVTGLSGSLLPAVSVVTGASGYVGRAVVHELLNRNEQNDNNESNRILCLVRPSRVLEEQVYWKNNAPQAALSCISVHPYDMLDGGITLKQALKEAEEKTSKGHDDSKKICIFHLASVFGPTEDHVQTARNNVRGTEDVIKTTSEFLRANKDDMDCRVILTSSMAAVRGSGQNPLNGEYYTHEDWNTFSKLGDNWGASYQWSKAESERCAWDLSKELNVPMVSICPSFVFGPPASSTMTPKSSASATPTSTCESYSITLVNQWIMGESQVQSRLFVDIRDVAAAHVEAGIRSNSVGKRYIVSAEKRVSSKAIAEILQKVRSNFIGKSDAAANSQEISYDAKFTGGAIPIGNKEVEAIERLKNELGVALRSVEDTFEDMGEILMNNHQKQESIQKN